MAKRTQTNDGKDVKPDEGGRNTKELGGGDDQSQPKNQTPPDDSGSINDSDFEKPQQPGDRQSASRKAEHNKKVEGAIHRALGKVGDGPKRLQGIAFGVGQKGHAYDAVTGPVVRELCKEAKCECNPTGFGVLADELDKWEPTDLMMKFVKNMLCTACHALADRMSVAGTGELDDEFLAQAPKEAKERQGFG